LYAFFISSIPPIYSHLNFLYFSTGSLQRAHF
jgi:hypothetical protein